jgi:hypothetical protein
MSNQEKRQQSVRASTGTAYSYNDDWMALFTAAGITSGTYNERLLVWINAQLSTAYTTLPDAMRAYAINQGVPSWNEMGTFTPGGGGGVPDLAILARSGDAIVDRSGNYIITRA